MFLILVKILCPKPLNPTSLLLLQHPRPSVGGSWRGILLRRATMRSSGQIRLTWNPITRSVICHFWIACEETNQSVMLISQYKVWIWYLFLIVYFYLFYFQILNFAVWWLVIVLIILTTRHNLQCTILCCYVIIHCTNIKHTHIIQVFIFPGARKLVIMWFSSLSGLCSGLLFANNCNWK